MSEWENAREKLVKTENLMNQLSVMGRNNCTIVSVVCDNLSEVIIALDKIVNENRGVTHA